ncbi:MAG: SagB/ThcOx family dehydrogenase [Defluviitaleaceae bacterium]|nr:SagB/ThcOx family dehydrogenase [Defluviitaleaceae bacterium]
MSKIHENRNEMKCPNFSRGMRKTDQQLGLPHPPHGKTPKGKVITLPAFDAVVINDSYTNLLDTRRTSRVFDEDVALTQAQLAYMLYTAFGMQAYAGKGDVASLRPAPSGGARHPFELYVAVQNVEGLEPGIYLYLPVENIGKKVVAIEYVAEMKKFKDTISSMLADQAWSKTAPATMFVSCVPYKAEWRYGEMAHRVMLIDLGHLGQNVMLSACALGLSSCCVAAFDQNLCDEIIGLDGVDEFVVYAIPFGKAKDK